MPQRKMAQLVGSGESLNAHRPLRCYENAGRGISKIGAQKTL
jgi:hypothetical protein